MDNFTNLKEILCVVVSKVMDVVGAENQHSLTNEI